MDSNFIHLKDSCSCSEIRLHQNYRACQGGYGNAVVVDKSLFHFSHYIGVGGVQGSMAMKWELNRYIQHT
eukprot:scaffold186300_cov34-Attheya_sp.AAC.2